ncbi:hypothetical protein LPB41_20590 [Thalassospira sp. MA62]|nr:hypothetical protein [Thalassospira sp. MA62]
MSFELVPSAQADEQVCLKIAMPEGDQTGVGLDAYRKAMADAGLCVDPIPLPNSRGFAAFAAGTVDGVFAGLEELPKIVGRDIVPSTETVADLDGLLIARDGGPERIEDLHGEAVGIWLGSNWSVRILGDYPRVVKVPRGGTMLMELLRKKRVDAILLNRFSVEMAGGVPDGYVAHPVQRLVVYSWLDRKFANMMPAFDQGIRSYRAVLERLIAKAHANGAVENREMADSSNP